MGTGVYKVFNSNDLTLFYSVYLCLILDLRDGNNKQNCKLKKTLWPLFMDGVY